MDLTEKRFAIVGAGNMGLALLRGLLESGSLHPQNISIRNKRKEKAEAVASKFGVRTAATNVDCVQGADVVILSVKPQIFSKVLEEVRETIHGALIISVAAGISTRRIERELRG